MYGFSYLGNLSRDASSCKLVIDTKNFGLKVEPKINENLEWNLKFSVIVIGQETQKQELVSRDS
jgi:hypothetical protein